MKSEWIIIIYPMTTGPFAAPIRTELPVPIDPRTGVLTHPPAWVQAAVHPDLAKVCALRQWFDEIVSGPDFLRDFCEQSSPTLYKWVSIFLHKYIDEILKDFMLSGWFIADDFAAAPLPSNANFGSILALAGYILAQTTTAGSADHRQALTNQKQNMLVVTWCIECYLLVLNNASVASDLSLIHI